MLRILRNFGLVLDDVFVNAYDAEAIHPNINTEEGIVFTMVALDTFIFKVKLIIEMQCVPV